MSKDETVRPKLTKAQVRTLAVLAAPTTNDWRCAYPGLRLLTLNALARLNLVRVRYDAGSMAFPTTSIKWRITEAGRMALHEATFSLREASNVKG